MISVIIPTYQSPQALDLCLTSAVKGQENLNQIIVVVDGYYELNREVLQKWQKYINILNLEVNQGLCKATNLGVYNAEYEKILIVNDDNVFPAGWDSTLEKFYNPDWVITPNQVEPRPSMFRQFIIQDLGITPESFDLEKFWEYCKNINFEEEIDDSGSTLPIFMSKQKYLAVGGWDEYYEQGMVADWDFFLKCSIAGLFMKRLYSCPFYHFSSLTINNERRQQAELNAHTYAKYKWGDYIKHNQFDNLKYI